MLQRTKIEYELFEKVDGKWVSCKITFPNRIVADEFYRGIVRDNPGKIFGLQFMCAVFSPAISSDGENFNDDYFA